MCRDGITMLVLSGDSAGASRRVFVVSLTLNFVDIIISSETIVLSILTGGCEINFLEREFKQI